MQRGRVGLERPPVPSPGGPHAGPWAAARPGKLRQGRSTEDSCPGPREAGKADRCVAPSVPQPHSVHSPARPTRLLRAGGSFFPSSQLPDLGQAHSSRGRAWGLAVPHARPSHSGLHSPPLNGDAALLRSNPSPRRPGARQVRSKARVGTPAHFPFHILCVYFSSHWSPWDLLRQPPASPALTQVSGLSLPPLSPHPPRPSVPTLAAPATSPHGGSPCPRQGWGGRPHAC